MCVYGSMCCVCVSVRVFVCVWLLHYVMVIRNCGSSIAECIMVNLLVVSAHFATVVRPVCFRLGNSIVWQCTVCA